MSRRQQRRKADQRQAHQQGVKGNRQHATGWQNQSNCRG